MRLGILQERNPMVARPKISEEERLERGREV